ncbi:MAG: LytTR family DNA-binding domain-containing protein [Hydrogenophaga sp.]|uniref:LytTR family DNA-binding domain-containing protein n=1 Tax=Hydrogenophaga sp. TaxID=1904254 RepID=UPI002730D839|nr:LytTR family DNA-binding domain-containing protein [Hydrogenophaga sp.]MDP2165455.1 LytTR family DNA-binding domain-containing protein [Hydrogenophaga sp.]
MSGNATHWNSWPERYRPYRRPAEIGFWVAVLTIHMLFNSITTWIDLRHAPFVQPLVWELSSNLTVGLLIPALVAFERRFPLRWDTLRRNLPWHLAGTLVFCAVHVLVMMALRKAAYASVGASYTVGNWAKVFAYEYLKDVRSYALILCAVFSYRLLLLRLQGEARVLDAPDAAAGSAPAAEAARPERFLVRKLRKEFLIAASDIEWLQAQGNYVGIHVNGHDYLLRSTLADFLGQLDPARFVQVHRSFAVNLDRVAEIEPLDSGDARLRMKDGSQVACSRRYRDALGSR